ncbi:hypothetical protein pdam_00013232 [Pocillopora damicornis]|uniref:Uncharacterized protein n=1 Tax=Pocillopora damicornis TaxID=46731 RepID=A0A3M6UAM3_POCDA|nr:hypothetical protein pdam_00013232 [Pocillopora damicornis]
MASADEQATTTAASTADQSNAPHEPHTEEVTVPEQCRRNQAEADKKAIDDLVCERDILNQVQESSFTILWTSSCLLRYESTWGIAIPPGSNVCTLQVPLLPLLPWTDC